MLHWTKVATMSCHPMLLWVLLEKSILVQPLSWSCDNIMFENWDANCHSWRSRRKCPQNENRNNAFDKSSISAWRSLFLLADFTSFRNFYKLSFGARIYKKLSAHQKNIPTHNHDKEICPPVYTKNGKLWPLLSDATHTNGPTARLGKEY